MDRQKEKGSDERRETFLPWLARKPTRKSNSVRDLKSTARFPRRGEFLWARSNFRRKINNEILLDTVRVEALWGNFSARFNKWWPFLARFAPRSSVLSLPAIHLPLQVARFLLRIFIKERKDFYRSCFINLNLFLSISFLLPPLFQ